MAKRISLREFQRDLAARLGSAQRGGTSRALLGVESGRGNERLWLLDLTDSGEIAPLSSLGTLTPVALTKPWFAGVVNIRGTLYSVVDFSAFRGGEATPRNSEARVLLIGARHGSNSALLVNRTLGLHAPTDLSPAQSTGAPTAPWQGKAYTDQQGGRWTHLNIPALLADNSFLDIAA